MGYGKQVDIACENGSVTVRDFCGAFPLSKVVEVVSKINTGAKYDSKRLEIGRSQRCRDKAVECPFDYFFMYKLIAMEKQKAAEFKKGVLTKDTALANTKKTAPK